MLNIQEDSQQEKVKAVSAVKRPRSLNTEKNDLVTIETPLPVQQPHLLATAKSHPHQWAIVLAGGEGERLRPLTEKWLGCHCPKQFCTFVGSKSMLQHTLDRTRHIVPSEQILTVVSCDHAKWIRTSIDPTTAGTMISQPANLGTAPGIFLPLTYILAADPLANVLIFPCDHFIHPEKSFRRHINYISKLAEQFEDRMILLGVEPDRPEADYGWIRPGPNCFSKAPNPNAKEIPACLVSAFEEKPSAGEAEHFLRKGYLWNTMIVAVKAKTLWNLGQQYFSNMMSLFEDLRMDLEREGGINPDTDSHQSLLTSIYHEIEPGDFSGGLLQRASDQSVVVPMKDVSWDDWGRPARIVESLATIGKKPVFDSTLLGF